MREHTVSISRIGIVIIRVMIFSLFLLVTGCAPHELPTPTPTPVDYSPGTPAAGFVLPTAARVTPAPEGTRLAQQQAWLQVAGLGPDAPSSQDWPAIEEAARLVGRQNLFFLVFQRNRPILDLMGQIPPENILTIRDDSLLHFLIDALRTLRRLRRKGIDAAVDLEGFARASVILMVLAGARRRVGFHRFTSEAPYRGDLLTHRLIYNFYTHTSLSFLSLV